MLARVDDECLVDKVVALRWAEELHQLMPTATTIAILVNPNNSNAEPDTRDAQIAARGIEPSITAARDSDFAGPKNDSMKFYNCCVP